MSDLKLRNNRNKHLYSSRNEDVRFEENDDRTSGRNLSDRENEQRQKFDSSIFNVKQSLNFRESTNVRHSESVESKRQLTKTRHFKQDCTSIKKEQDPILRAIFSYENKSVDLELNETCLRWSFISDSKSKKSSSASINEIELKTVYNIEAKLTAPIRRTNNKLDNSRSLGEDLNEVEDHVNGFVLHVFVKEKPNLYKYKSFVFTHPHRESCKDWIKKSKELIPNLQIEKKVLILMNPYAGEKKTRAIFNSQINPLLITANIKYTLIEFHDQVSLREGLINNHINFNDYYGTIIMAGDSSVSKAINVIIEQEALRNENIDLCEVDQLSSRLRTPICLIPVGSTNMIAHSIYGTLDLISPLMYLFYGITIKIDLSAVFVNRDKLHSFGFGYSCGFGSTLARYFKRYAKLGWNKIPTSIARGTAKKKHRVVEVEISFIRGESSGAEDEPCTRRCQTCGLKEQHLQAKKTEDQVEEFDPIANTLREIENNLRTTFKYSNKSNNWELISGQFMHISLLSNAMNWDMASGRGLSKFGHLGDGLIDLILVDSVSRKDFYRFVKRHTNDKNQLNLSFVKYVRIKEAKIRIKNSEYWPDDLSEQFRLNSRLSKSYANNELFFKELETEEEYDDEDVEYAQTNKVGLKKRVYSIKSIDKRSDNGSIENESKKIKKNNMFIKKSKSIFNLFKSEEKNKNEISLSKSFNGGAKRFDEEIKRESVFHANNNFSTNKSFKMPSVWNCDWNLNVIPEMHIKCFKQFLPVYAAGIDPDTEYEDSMISCVSGI